MSALIEYKLAKTNLNALYNVAVQANLKDSGVQIRNLFRARYSDIESYKTDFSKAHVTIESKAGKDFDFDQHNLEYEQFMDKFYSIKVCYEDCFGKVSEGLNVGKVQQSSSSNCLQLPKLKLPLFNGDVTQWLNFKSIYCGLIHDNEQLSPVQKMHYLVSSLGSDAANLIRHLQISDSNYRVAYDLLIKRFDNKRLIADTHLDLVLSLPNIQAKVNNNLRTFVDTLKENLRALEALDMPVQEWSFVLLHILLKKMDVQLRNAFELQVSDSEIPNIDKLVEFLEIRCKAMECSTVQVLPSKPKETDIQSKRPRSSYVSSVAEVCVCCKRDAHALYSCQRFLAMTPDARKSVVQQQRLCFNCLKPHSYKQCKSNNVCKYCKGFHNSLIHIQKGFVQNQHKGQSSPSPRVEYVGSGSEVNKERNGHSEVTEVTANSSTFQPNTNSNQVYTTVMLATAVIHVLDGKGKWRDARALIDNGSQYSFMTPSCAKRLGLEVMDESFPVTPFGVYPKKYVSGSVKCQFKSRFSATPTFSGKVFLMDRLTSDLPSVHLPEDMVHQYKQFDLADPTFYKKGKIDFVLGADFHEDIHLKSDLVKVHPRLPSALNTKLGWIIFGWLTVDLDMGSEDMASSNVTCFHALCDADVNKTIAKFWEVEEPPGFKGGFSPEDAQAEEHFQSTHLRDITGRYEVQLPFRQDSPELGNTKELALKRFYALERRLIRDPAYKEMYTAFLKDYEDLGHMSLVPEAEQNKGLYTIPHHGVFKASSSTTKLRVVFDASMRSQNGVSLNDVLLPGPKLQHDISDIILSFRIHEVVFSTDIKKMYRQIKVHSSHRPYQRILWRDNSDEEVKEYNLNTVTYGVSSAPFLAMRCLRELALCNQEQFPIASRVLLNDVFVDDVVTGASCLQDALHLKDELVSLLASGGFELRKWCSNSKDFLSGIPHEHCEVPLDFNVEGDFKIKVLGLKWSPEQDCFTYEAQIDDRLYTKRALLSNIARLFDPCGWLSPVIFKAKALMQELWLLQLDWDELPPQEFVNKWKSFTQGFDDLKKVRIPRHVFKNDARGFQLHAFSDASEKGYSAVVYIRVTDSHGTNTVFLFFAKSKVAPLKQRLTIPRMELNGACLAAKLVKYVKNLLTNLEFESTHIWCDSTIVLSWLRNPVHSLRMYEGNRVSQIHEMVEPSVWRYVPSSLNPADVSSRGLNPDELVNNRLWWGPEWLCGDSTSWPVSRQQEQADRMDNVDILSKETLSCALIQEDVENLQVRFSSLKRLLRISALCLRFGKNCTLKVNRIHGHITHDELEKVLLIWVKLVQAVVFSKELALVKQGKGFQTGLKHLAPFVDSSGILRVGGRLQNADLPYDSRHPMLLPRRYQFTNLLIDHYHVEHLHAGPSLLLSILRQRFWILAGRQAVRLRVFKCHRCFRCKPTSTDQFMGNLPTERVTLNSPFLSAAVDFGGPFFVKESKLRKARVNKAYLGIFVCMATKAVHLELISDLSSEGFIAALHRMTARRGICRDIFSDNGTNFRGASNTLNEVYQYLAKNVDKLNADLSELKLHWHFSPASAPHFNGIAESAIKSAKYHLVRVVGEQRLTFEELSTLLCRVEAILNSRPLCPMSSDPSDLLSLTPGHFLIGRPLVAIPERDVSNVPTNRLSRWHLLQKMSQGFWNQWSNEYLHTLQQRNKWHKLQRNFKINDLVLIKEDNIQPLQWKLGRIAELHPGKDSIVRVATVRTANGMLVRPIVKLCLLPQ